MRINFGILGAGRISKIHCHNIYNNPKAKILKIYDINNKSSESLAKKYKTYSCNKDLEIFNLKIEESSLKKLDIELGKFISDETIKLINSSNEKVDLISSHGHTVFHEPKEKINYQIGNPFEIYNNINIPLVYNFREFDVILGGQGAPLVPYGEEKLFSVINFCVNLGGIINISSLNN